MIQTRILSGLKKPGRSNRDMFIDSFSAIAFIVYGTLALSDIRIKPLEETHSLQIIEVLSAYSETLKEAFREVREEGQGPFPTPK
jgi:hypothetical protein